ncbi:hypothetical protein [Paraburkholderia sp. CNPSo 3281]|uniref:hypothetical protein n=1 Tax=Paraburkholderia sp. CNPSo 3281 TaxID=2940933 RepID=UPI0020B9006E|nr:hypothetical protein [Paraburkholderia sp. CNPSo 3281]MCP3718956.1 hypothetical protein [Paraburkholderia sp. CNPSo 3281]
MKSIVVTAYLAKATRQICCVAMVLSCLAGPVLAEESEGTPGNPATAAPVYKVGDTWTFSVCTTNTNSDAAVQHVESVVTVADNQTTLNVPRKGAPPLEMVFNAQGDVISDGGSTYEPAKGLLDFPMAVGKSWDIRHVRHWASGGNMVVSAHASVEAFEKVQVDAGSFDAYKIVVHGLNKGKLSGGPASRFDITYWYAPSTKRIVKYVYQWTNYLHLENYTYELTAYSLAP